MSSRNWPLRRLAPSVRMRRRRFCAVDNAVQSLINRGSVVFWQGGYGPIAIPQGRQADRQSGHFSTRLSWLIEVLRVCRLTRAGSVPWHGRHSCMVHNLL